MSQVPDNPLFELRAVEKTFSRVQVLDHIDLAVERKKTTVIIGPSGCGKTVLIKHLIVLLRPDRGQVLFDGRRIDRFKEDQLVAVRRRCGFLFQAGALFDSQTVRRNVAFPLLQHTKNSRSQIDRIVREKLALVGMGDFLDRLPAELSGGQQKRVALARAIALSPEVILYDEPTTGLDPIRSDVISELIIKLKKQLNITSVVVTHDMKSAYKIADRIIMLDNGRIIADGTPDDIRSSQNETVLRFIHGRSEGLNDNTLEQVESK